ncbi:MAG TPA: DUF1592 domain-containing protein [Chthoniobacteraceae bacterium]|nr:DUF1592 domain-containing protein [Chthoniobacteraceae bacterium]
MRIAPIHTLLLLAGAISRLAAAAPDLEPFLENHCYDCHDTETHKGGLDLTSLKQDFANPDTFARWVKVHDQMASGEMPPKKKPRPPADDLKSIVTWLDQSLVAAERARLDADGHTGLHRLTRVEYENTIRDLFGLDGIGLQVLLPADGSAHGFDKNSDALDISHVNIAKYVEAAEKTLDLAIVTRPEKPEAEKHRVSLANTYQGVLMLGTGDCILLRDKKPDPNFPPAGQYRHLARPAHSVLGLYDPESSVGVFRHEDESWYPTFEKFAAIYPGRYKVRASVWGCWWDKGVVKPARGVEAARLSVVQPNESGGQPASYVLGYYDAPSVESRVHELDVWLNQREMIGFNAASLAPVVIYYGRQDRAMGFTGPCVISDWVEVEGPIYDVWPPRGHQLLFGQLPFAEFNAADRAGIRPPVHKPIKQEIRSANNRPEVKKDLWTVESSQPLADADRLLAGFLPKAFRRPVDAELRKEYVDRVDARLKAGDCFETAMRSAYRAALCSPDFLYHLEPAGRLDDFALASRLSYFFWNSMPDDELIALAAKGTLYDAKVLDAQLERLLKDAKAQRFVEDFLGQWLKLRDIGANDPDKKLYPEFSPYLQDSMVAETRAYFRELLEKNLDAGYLVKSDFAMLNEKLAQHYGIPGVSGPAIRRVPLPAGSPRGGFLTQAAILKVTANGTTTSPVVRGAFVMARLLGLPPDPQPPNIAAVEPDVRGATTIRELLDKHRSDSSCASCHAKIDPAGFALESFDVIGGERDRYRAVRDAEDPEPPAARGAIDPFIKINFKLTRPVDPAGQLPDGRAFSGVADLEQLLAANRAQLLKNLTEQLAVYATGRGIAYSDRAEIAGVVAQTEKQGGGLRTLLHEIVRSPLFQTR